MMESTNFQLTPKQREVLAGVVLHAVKSGKLDPGEILADYAPSEPAAFANAYLAELQVSGSNPVVQMAMASDANWQVLVFAAPRRAKGPSGLSTCQRECLAVLSQCESPQTARSVRLDIQDRGLGDYREGEVRLALEELVDRGILHKTVTDRFHIPAPHPSAGLA